MTVDDEAATDPYLAAFLILIFETVLPFFRVLTGADCFFDESDLL